MIQKATWFIPGILVTLLLGLLWAMPAFAADAGDIEFLDESGGDEIGFVSLNGPAASGGFWAQVTDQDLNAPTQYAPGKAGRRTLDQAVASRPEAVGLFDWTNLADLNDDGKININDIKVFDGDGKDANDVGTGGLTLDVVNGKLHGSATGTRASHVEFHINERTTIGAFVNSHSNPIASPTQAQDPDPDNGGSQLNVENTAEITLPATSDLLVDEEDTTAPSWLSVLADKDGDGKLNDEITATVTVEYEVDDPDNPGTPLEGKKTKEDVALKVTLVEEKDDTTGDLTGYAVRVNAVDVVVKDADAEDGEVDVVIVHATASNEVNIIGGIALSYNTVYVGMGTKDQIGMVTVDSSGGTKTSVAFRETSASSGAFGAAVMICNSDPEVDSNCAVEQELVEDAGDNTPGMVMLPVDAAGDTVTVVYRDASPRTNRSSNISLDTNAPAFSNFAPASGTAGKDAEPDVSFEVVDGESGVEGGDDPDDNSIRVVGALFEADADPDVGIGDIVTIIRGDLNVDDISDGFSVETRLREGGTDELDAGDEQEYEIRWWAVAMDSAGNTGVSDSDSDTACTYSGAALVDSDGDALTGEDLLTAIMAADDVGTDDEVNCDPNIVRVDTASPALVAAETGTYYDTDEDNDEGSGSLTSIVARFDEALDCDSVSADDFEVGGAAPNSATCVGSDVYLDVDEMGSNDTPAVEVAEESIGDRAGNLIGADADVESTDGIPAGLTVTITGTGEGTRTVTSGTITITVSSDERLKGRPDVIIQRVEDDYTLGDDQGGTADPTGNNNEWELDEDLDDAGLYNVYVMAEDRVSSGPSTAGVDEFDEDTIKGGKAFLFEVDIAVSVPMFTPLDEGTTDNAGIFIRANFNNEDNEYGLAEPVETVIEKAVEDDTDTADVDESKDAVTADVAKPTDDPAAVDTDADFDTHSTVTLVSATFNDEDVTDDVISRDNILFVYRPGNLENGEHTFEIEVEDNAGNEREISTTFTKIDKPAYKLGINPGRNLVSFPADPADGDINAVFGGEGNEDIITVLTYNNSSGLWLTATKGADGMFMGDLTTINGMNGYWVVAVGIVDLSVLLGGNGDLTSPPPHIAVSEGWNLIGVVDTQERAEGERFFAASYFTNIDAEVAYGYDTINGRLHRISLPDSFSDTDLITDDSLVVETGKGYWIYANEAGIIIP